MEKEGEALSIEETNALRIKLGLKPLRVDNKKEQKVTENKDEEHKEEGNPTETLDKSDQLKQRLNELREERLKTAELTGIKPLGEKENDADDDLHSWINKSRKAEERKRVKERAEALKMQKVLQEQEEFGEEEASGPGRPAKKYTERNLKGLKIGHSVDQIREGGQVILTLKDQGILDDDGELHDGEDVLEDTLLAQQEKVDKAKELAKPSSKYDEDEGKSILSKYDDPTEKSATFMELDAEGKVNQRKLEEQEEIRKKLKDGINYGKLHDSADTMKRVLNDFWTPEEISSMEKPKGKKKRRKKNIRMKKKDIDELEAQATTGGEENHHGQRIDGEQSKKKTEIYLNDQAKRDAAYSVAAAKAARVTEDILKPQQMQVDGEAEEEEDEFFKELNKTRKAALSKQRKNSTLDQIEILKKAEKDANRGKSENIDLSSFKGEVFTEASEFCNIIKLEDNTTEEKTEGDGAEAMQVEEKAEEKDETGVEKVSEAASPILEEVKMDKGLGSALRLLQGRGDLQKTVRWSGRTNDMKHNNVRDVVESFNDKNRFAQDVENALTRKDEFGRVMTPKEAFRELCYKFHGKPASKNKKEKRIQKYLEEQKLMEMTTGDTPLNTMNRLKDFQKQSSTPYLVLSGKINPGQSSDHRSSFALEKDNM